MPGLLSDMIYLPRGRRWFNQTIPGAPLPLRHGERMFRKHLTFPIDAVSTQDTALDGVPIDGQYMLFTP